MGAAAVFSADSLTAWRATLNRIRRHPLMTGWFLVLVLTGTWLGLRTAELLARGSFDTGDLHLRPHTLLMVYFLIMMGKSVVDTNARCTQNREMIMLLAQPVPVRTLLWGKLAYITLSNLSVLAASAGIATAVHAVFTPGLYVPLWLVAELIPLTLLASSMGFCLSIITSQPRLLSRLAGAALLGQLAAALYIALESLSPSPVALLGAALVFYAISLGAAALAGRFFLAAWNHEVSGAEGYAQRATRAGSGRLLRALTRRLHPETRELLKKEILINISRKEVGGTLFTILGVAIVLVYMRGRATSASSVPAPFVPLVPPLLVCIGLYVSAVLLYALLGLGSLGKEGRNFWILKHLPVDSGRVFRAKAGALLLFTPVLVLSISLPLPLLSGMGPLWALFFVIAAVALALAYTAVGIWSGTVFPNFDEGTRGTPDVMTMYLVMMACLLLGGVMVGLPGLVMSRSAALGILCMLLSADWGALFLVHAIERSARNYDAMEAGV
ncbi:MAG: hypothetical protein QW379_07705 [Thermoplasmata archaeon]